MLLTFESDAIVYLIGKLDGSKQRSNARNEIKKITLDSIDKEIGKYKDLLRELRSESEQSKRIVYGKISTLEQLKLKIQGGEYGF